MEATKRDAHNHKRTALWRTPWRGGVEGESPVGERAQVNAIARALGVDWNTAEKWLTRFERLRRPPASE